MLVYCDREIYFFVHIHTSVYDVPLFASIGEGCLSRKMFFYSSHVGLYQNWCSGYDGGLIRSPFVWISFRVGDIDPQRSLFSFMISGKRAGSPEHSLYSCLPSVVSFSRRYSGDGRQGSPSHGLGVPSPLHYLRDMLPMTARRSTRSLTRYPRPYNIFHL